MNFLHAGYKNLLPLPDAFGGGAFRGISLADDEPILLLEYPLGADFSTRADLCGFLARKWESLAPGHPVLAPIRRWFFEGSNFILVFRDPGGPVLSDVLDAPGGIFPWEKYLFPFVDQWERLETDGVTWTALDLRRMVLGPMGPVSFDLLHLADPGKLSETWFPPFATEDDLLWVAPELTRRTSWSADLRSGLYSFGVFFYRVAAGTWPLKKADPLEMVHCLLNQMPNLGHPRLRSLGAGFQAILKKLLQKDPKDRYQTLRGLRWDLGRRALAPEQSFVLGTRDRLLPVSELDRTYGRRAETGYLAELVDRVLLGQTAALVFRGAQGLGKTRLIEDLRQRAEAGGILWLPGKFDQFDLGFSSGGVVQALGVWVESLGSLDPVALGAFASTVQGTLGRNLRIATNLLPKLSPLLGMGPELPALNPEEQQRRFLAVLFDLVRAAATVRPLVLALEDLHWADEVSLQFLESLVSNLPPGVALAGTCRVLRTDGTSGFLAQVAQGPGPGLVDLAPLGEPDVLELLGECSELDPEDRAQLARILVRHSSGNPFNLRILLREVNVRQAAVFDEVDGRWRLQAGKLRNLPYDGAADLVLDRVRALGPVVQQALLVASLLGVQFSKEELVAAGPVSPELFDLMAEELLDLGIWESPGPNMYRFTHDKLQEAVFEMSGEVARSDAHLRIGRDRLARWRWGAVLTPAEVTVHLNFNLGALDESERIELVELNLRAGEDVWASGDPRGGLGFFKAAIDLGGPALWDRDHDQAWKLYQSAAETAFIEGQRTLGDSWCDKAVLLCRYPVQRSRVRALQQSGLFNLGDLRGAVQAGIKGLGELGIHLPKKPGKIRVLGAHFRVEAALLGRRPGAFPPGPLEKDLRARSALQLLVGIILPAFLSGQTNLFGLAVLVAVRLTLKVGLCPETAPVCAGFAAYLAVRGDHRGARDFGQRALDIGDRSGGPGWKPLVRTLTAMFSFGWFEPWDKLGLRFEESWRSSEETGESPYRSYSLLFSVLLNQGEDIPSRIRKTEEVLAMAQKNRQPLTLRPVSFALEAFKALSSGGQTDLLVGFDGLDPGYSLARNHREEGQNSLAVSRLAILQTSFLLGNLDRAREELGRIQPLKNSVVGTHLEGELVLFSGLVRSDLVRRHGGWGDRKGLEDCVRTTRSWSRLSPSFDFHASLLAAELSDLRNRVLDAQNGYFRAIEAADRLGNLPYMALSRERAARFHLRRLFQVVARHLFEESLGYWRRYGAWTKVNLLETEAGIFTGIPESKTTQEDPPWDLDGVALVRALDAISAEIQIDRLVRSVLQLILENSGADQVSLFLVHGGESYLEGESGTGGFKPGARIPLDAATDLPRSFLRKVIQDRVPFIRETLSETDLKKEPVLGARGVKSLICLPLVSQDDLKALVYLENKVSPGILTKERILTIERLSSTMGIALQNAQLFDQVRQANESLERRVDDRTRELQASQKKIVLQEKLASLGALTAGIAHELKNPLNIITNFAESSMELMVELEGVLADARDSLPPGARKELDYLLPELVQNMKDLRVQGQRGDSIIRSMLMHSRSDAGIRTQEDLAVLVKESLSLSYHGIRATQKDFRCRTEEHYADQIPSVRMIRPNLGRVLINLFTNAFQAVLEKQRRLGGDYLAVVSVSVEAVDNEVRLVVEDNGPGIPKEIQERIFQPFFTTKPPGEGTGLGLSISFEIIQEELGGTLEVESQPGTFTRFVIRIPLGEKE